MSLAGSARKGFGKFIRHCKNVRALNWVVRLNVSRHASSYAKRAKKAKLNERSIFFESYSGSAYACSPKAIYQQLCSDPRFDKWTFVWAFGPKGRPLLDESPEIGRARIVRTNTKDYYDALATCKYWVRNNRVSEFVQKKPGQVYIQTWHGSPLKALGYDVGEVRNGSFASGDELARQNELDSQKWDFFLSPSSFATDCFASAFHFSEKLREEVVLEIGYPRNDALTGSDVDAREKRVSEVRKRLLIPGDKKVLLYAPTWRDDQKRKEGGYYSDMLLDLDAAARELSDEWVVLVRLHSLVKNRFDLRRWRGFAIDVSDVGDINDLYLVSDALCTDYSSVFFDFANLRRPIYFYWPDLDHYRGELHEFYLDVDDLVGPKCLTTDDLLGALSRFDEWMDCYGADLNRFLERFCPLDEGCSSSRAISRCIIEPNASNRGE